MRYWSVWTDGDGWLGCRLFARMSGQPTSTSSSTRATASDITNYENSPTPIVDAGLFCGALACTWSILPRLSGYLKLLLQKYESRLIKK